MAKATASPPARRRSGDRPRGKAKTPKHKTKETSPPKHESAWKHEINRGFIAPFLLTRSVHFEVIAIVANGAFIVVFALNKTAIKRGWQGPFLAFSLLVMIVICFLAVPILARS